MPGQFDTVVQLTLAGLVVALVGGLAALVLYLFRQRRGSTIHVAPKQPAPDGITVVIVFAIFLLLPMTVRLLLTELGFFQFVYGQQFVGRLNEERSLILYYLWASLFALPLEVLLITAITHYRCNYHPLRLGQFSHNLLTGYWTWLLITPMAFLCYAIVSALQVYLLGQEPEQHPLGILGETAGRLEKLLIILVAVVSAPIREELVFRGVLLPWLSATKQQPANGPMNVEPEQRHLLTMLMAVMIAAMPHIHQLMEVVQIRLLILHSIPIIFICSLLPLMFYLPNKAGLRREFRLRSRMQVAALITSSALFAAFHASVWPTPVPLFVLSIALAYLATRTRSLVGPILVHSMFNAVSTIYLFLGTNAR
ncbi:MAG: CPBP family intramembrane glutamic endopeptidase [Zavarzinella sp.]